MLTNFNDQSYESFFKIAKKKEGDVMEWLKKVTSGLLEEAQFRTEQQRIFLEAYRGFEYDKGIRSRDRLDPFRNQRRRIRKLKVNHIYDLLETKVSQMTKLKADISVLPRHAQWTDKSAARVAKSVIRNIFEQEQFDMKAISVQRLCRILGEVYMFICWNKEKGDLAPAYVEAKNAGLDKVYDPETNSTIDLSQPIKVGDVELQIELPWRVLLQRKNNIDDCDWAIKVNICEKDKVVFDYPKAEQRLDESDGVNEYNSELLETVYMENHVAVYEFYHKKTKYLPNGMYIKYIDNAILEKSDLPYEHGDLPFERLTDIDMPNVLNGVSKLEFALILQNRYDDVSTLIAKNIYLTAHAKWVVPESARIKIEQLGNDNTIVTHKGVQGPKLEVVQPNPPEVYKFRDDLEVALQKMLQLNHGIARGEMPKGVTATSAFKFLSELENERASSEISKYADFIKRVSKKALATAGQYYAPEDGRLIRVVGENNKYLIRHFDTADLSKPYDIKFENSSGFPESQAAKQEQLMEMLQRYPQMFSPERWEQLFEFSDADKAISIATAAVESADSENEDIFEGIEVFNPERFEDQITHWNSHVAAAQNRSFKEEATPEAYDNLLEHINKHEVIMIEMSKTNPTFEDQLARLPNFPVTFHENFVPPMTSEQKMAIAQGQANMGQPVTAIAGGIPQGEDQ